MKAHIRKILDREKPKPKRGGFHRSLTVQPVKPAHYLGSIADTQSKEELKARELRARVAMFRIQQRLLNAVATGEPCSQKACPFPAVLDGECRQHAKDRIAESSTLGSALANCT